MPMMSVIGMDVVVRVIMIAHARYMMKSKAGQRIVEPCEECADGKAPHGKDNQCIEEG